MSDMGKRTETCLVAHVATQAGYLGLLVERWKSGSAVDIDRLGVAERLPAHILGSSLLNSHYPGFFVESAWIAMLEAWGWK